MSIHATTHLLHQYSILQAHLPHTQQMYDRQPFSNDVSALLTQSCLLMSLHVIALLVRKVAFHQRPAHMQTTVISMDTKS